MPITTIIMAIKTDQLDMERILIQLEHCKVPNIFTVLTTTIMITITAAKSSSPPSPQDRPMRKIERILITIFIMLTITIMITITITITILKTDQLEMERILTLACTVQNIFIMLTITTLRTITIMITVTTTMLTIIVMITVTTITTVLKTDQLEMERILITTIIIMDRPIRNGEDAANPGSSGPAASQLHLFSWR